MPRIGALGADWQWEHGGRVRRELDYLVEVEGDLAAPRLEAGKHDAHAWVGPEEVDLLLEGRTDGDARLRDIVPRASGSEPPGMMPRGDRGPTFRSLLYSEPRLYDLVFPDADEATASMVLAAVARWLPAAPRSVLDLGCGTGRLLETLAKTVPECYGVDLLESNIAYAKAVRPGITFLVGDMRAVRLAQTFGVVTSLGNALSYALTDDDLVNTVRTFAAHARAGTLLVVDPLSARAYLDGHGFEQRVEGRVDTPDFRATSVAEHELDREACVLRRVRTWRIDDRPDVEDYAEYRLLLPEEIQRHLEAAGFDVLGMYDNRAFQPTDLTGAIPVGPDVAGMRGRKLYVFARKQ